MKRKFSVILSLILVLTLFGSTAAVQAADGISVVIDGQRVNFPGQQPVNVDGRVLVPVRGVFEHLGFEVSWHEAFRIVSLISDNYIVWLPFANNFAVVTLPSDMPFEHTAGTPIVRYLRGEEWHYASREGRLLDVPPQIIGGSTMLPIRAVVESVGYYVNWDSANQTVLISSTPFEGQALIPMDGAGHITIRGYHFSKSLTELDLTELDLENEDIVPLRYMVNLTKLNLSNSTISDLSPLANLTNLEDLQLNNTQVRNLAPLANLTNLRTLWLSNHLWIGENLTSDDLEPLSGLTNLRDLNLHMNEITDLTPLAGLTNLWRLSIGGNEITDLAPLASLTNLAWLDLQRIPATDATPLAALPNLQTLQWQSGQLSDLTPFAYMTNLRILILTWHQITDITPLAGLTNLSYLNLAGNYPHDLNRHLITDITPLAGLTNLTRLSLTGNPITDWSPVDHVEQVSGRP